MCFLHYHSEVPTRSENLHLEPDFRRAAKALMPLISKMKFSQQNLIKFEVGQNEMYFFLED